MTAPPAVYASISSYALGRVLGAKAAEQVLTDAVIVGEKPNALGHIPGALTLHWLARDHDVELRCDGGATCIGKTRSRHFHAALHSGRDVWVTVDDDVEASPETTRWLVEAVHSDEPRICLAPCVLRGQPDVVGVEWTSVYVERRLSGGGLARRARRGGFGLVAVNRAALQAIAMHVPRFLDDDGQHKPAAFLELVNEAGQWLGEDFAFFHRLPPKMQVEGLLTGETVHAGHRLDLTRGDGPTPGKDDPLTQHP